LDLDKSKGKLAEQINKIPNLSQLQKDNFIKAGVLFYDYLPSNDKKMNIVDDNGKMSFETYGFKTPVNFEGMFMDGLMSSKISESGRTVSFIEPLEFFKAANLTNRIQALCKNRKANSFAPFSL